MAYDDNKLDFIHILRKLKVKYSVDTFQTNYDKQKKNMSIMLVLKFYQILILTFIRREITLKMFWFFCIIYRKFKFSILKIN